VGLLLVALIVGLAAGRFLFFSAAGPSTARAPQAATLEATVAALERTVEASPADLGAWQRLGIAYTDQAIAVGDPTFYELAGSAFERADALEPDAPDTLIGRGKLALSLHEFSRALELGEQALAARPVNAPTLGVVVDAQVELGRYEEAAATLQQMLDVRPDIQALARTSYLRELNGDLDGARLAMRQAAAASSKSPLDQATVATLEGDLQLLAGDLDAATASFDRAIDLAPELPLALAGKARVLAARGDLDDALALLAEATQRQPVPTLVVLHADLLRLAGRADEAADADQVVRAVAALQSSAGQIVDLEAARFEADRGEDPAGAVELARKAFDARPDNIFTADALGWALYRAGDIQAAVPHMETAVRLGTADPGLRVRAATVFDAAGQPDRARQQLEAAFTMAPWTALPERDDAAALAERLGLSTPPAWTGR